MQKLAKEAEELEAKLNELRQKEKNGEQLSAEELEMISGNEAMKKLQELKQKIGVQKLKPVLPKIEVKAITVKPPQVKPVEYFGTPSLIVA